MKRRTISKECSFQGVGLHSGKTVTMKLLPSTGARGIVFIRVDLDGDDREIDASASNVIVSPLNTRLVNSSGAAVSTIEHLMSALSALEITDLRIEIDGPEIPILDGSSAFFYREIVEIGTSELASETREIVIEELIEVQNHGAIAKVEPSERFSISFSIDFPDQAIGRQSFTTDDPRGDYVSSIADARTFCRKADIEAMRKHGLVLGGSFENSVVIDGEEVLTPGGLRHPDEAVRHKVLDALGDLWLDQINIVGKFTFEKSGHSTNVLLLQKILDTYDYSKKKADNVVHLPFANVNLDWTYGAAMPPKYISDEEQHVLPESVEILSSKSATLLRALMETASRDLGPAVATFSQLPILWVINNAGQMVFSVEEVVTDGSKRFVRPRLRRDQPGNGETRLGHPALVAGQPARIGGELYFDPGWGHEPRGWKLTNGSGRYGLREGREVSHLLSVVDLLRSHNIEVRPSFIPVI